jgi:hypothetical protein
MNKSVRHGGCDRKGCVARREWWGVFWHALIWWVGGFVAGAISTMHIVGRKG